MSATLPELCIRFVLEELSNDTRSKHTCILINRHWCMASIHEIWKHPLYYCQELEQKDRESLGLESNTKTTFDYTTFSQWICPNGLRSCVKLWLDEKIKQEPDKYSNLLKTENKTIFMIGKALCEHLIINSKKLIGVQLNQNEINIFELPQAEKVLSKVTHFITRFSCEPSRIGKLPNVLSLATEISKNIQVLNITCFNVEKENDISIRKLSQLIRNQKRLKEFTLTYWNPGFMNLWTSVLQQYNTLTTIILETIIFNESNPFLLHELGIFKNLQVLTIENFSPNLETLYINELEDYLIEEDEDLILFDFLCSLDWEFNNDSFSKFLKICKEKGINFKTLIFAQSGFFNDLYLYELLKFYGDRKLDELVLHDMNNFSKECLKEVKKQVGIVKFAKGYPEKFNLSINFEEDN
uniref:F-box domain-containing protein n=1 Tax=Rhizophagus irregularis (strain DAOM 181602 / DAOM 197198 / MUCL 43194) TaxID=747089 RepID=U9TKW8_RHIID